MIDNPFSSDYQMFPKLCLHTSSNLVQLQKPIFQSMLKIGGLTKHAYCFNYATH